MNLTILSLLLVATVLASPFPVGHEVDKRICGSVILPSTLVQLNADNPNTSFPNTAHTNGSFLIYQGVDEPSGQVADKISQLVGFSGPIGAYGCSLGITFPSNYVFPVYTGGSSAATLNIYTSPEPLPANPTYNNVVISPGLFGTVTVQAGQSTVINSESCPTNAQGGLAFVFMYPDWVTRPASIGWDEYVNELNGAGLTGVYLSYDC